MEGSEFLHSPLDDAFDGVVVETPIVFKICSAPVDASKREGIMFEDGAAGAEVRFASTASTSVGASHSANKTTINQLPNEMLTKIFSYLDVEDLAFRTHLVCKRWASMTQDSHVWKAKVYKVESHIPLSTHIQILEQCPQLEGVCFTHTISKNDVNTVSRNIVQHIKNLKILSVHVDANICRSVKNILLAKRETLLNIDLWFLDNILLNNFRDVCSAETLECVALCQKLQSLSLRGHILCDTNILEAISLNCTHLQTLDLKECEIIRPKFGMECLLQSSSGLTALYTTWSKLDEEGTIQFIAKHCPALEKFCVHTRSHLRYCYHVEGFNIVPFKDLHNLKELMLPDLQDDILHQAISLFESGAMKNLMKLDLTCNCWVNNVFLDTVFRKCPNLQELSFQGCYELTSPAFENIYLLKNLQHLNLRGCVGLREEALTHIVKCKTIKFLDIKYIVTFTQNILMLCCENLKMLQKLHIVVDQINEEDLKKVPRHLLPDLNCFRSFSLYEEDKKVTKWDHLNDNWTDI